MELEVRVRENIWQGGCGKPQGRYQCTQELMHSTHTLAILKGMQIVLGTHNMKLCRNIFQGSNEPIIIGELPSPNA